MCGTTHAVLSCYAGNFKTAFLINPIFWLWVFWSTLAYVDLWHRGFTKEWTIGRRIMDWAMTNRWSKAFHVVAFMGTLVYRNLIS